MDILVEWLIFLVRWLHVMAGITWIGTSFYFNWFDAGVCSPKESVFKENIRGTLDEIHGGSFYYHEQYWPNQHPERLLVHSWPAKTTFYTGLLMMTLIYWLGASVYLIDKQVANLSAPVAVLISICSIVISWLYYVSLCKFFKHDKSIFIGMCLYILLAAYAYTHLFGGRGAYLSMGAMLGSLMGLNVIKHIVPNHIAMRNQLLQGLALDTQHGHNAKRHSQHNNYLTIPVVVCMMSNHFALAYHHSWSWLILSLLLLTGWAVRHYLNVMYKQEHKPVGVLLMIVISLLSAIAITLVPDILKNDGTAPPKILINDTQAMVIIQHRCVSCHSESPVQPGFASAPQGLILNSLDKVLQNKDKIIYQVVTTKSMPLGNVTSLTDTERMQLSQWLQKK